MPLGAREPPLGGANENAPGLYDRGRLRILEHETGLELATPTLAKGAEG